MVEIEAAPYIYVDGNEQVKKELYSNYFDVSHLGNIKGERPIMGIGFWETTHGYASRLKEWEEHEKNVYFEGWTCKDMRLWQVFTNKDGVGVVFEINSYYITIGDKEYHFPVLPETIDDLINDFKRVGVKLFWKESIVNKFGYENLNSDKRTVEYHKIMNGIRKENE